jgi:hypothetical protein
MFQWQNFQLDLSLTGPRFLLGFLSDKANQTRMSLSSPKRNMEEKAQMVQDLL